MEIGTIRDESFGKKYPNPQIIIPKCPTAKKQQKVKHSFCIKLTRFFIFKSKPLKQSNTLSNF